MATTEERLAALEAKMAQLTATTPTTYYTHQYSGEEIDAAVGRAITGGALDTSVTNVSNQLGTFVRPNLLDNWYFGRPVNQRGQTSYSTDWIYTIDRWQVSQNTTLTVNNGSVSSNGDYWFEPLEEIVDALRGRTVTISLLFASGELEFATGVVPATWGVWDNIALSGHVVLKGIGEDSKRLWFMVNDIAENILAAKLELGPTQTLAHREGDKWVLNEIPDYGEQLRRCQRYAIKIGKDTAGDSSLVGFALCTSSTLASAFISLPVSMRTKPSVTFKNVYLSLGSSVVAVTNIAVYENTQNGIYCALSVSGGLTVGQTVAIRISDGGYIMPSADL